MILKGRIFGATDRRKGTCNVFCFIIVVLVRKRQRCTQFSNGVVIPFGDYVTAGLREEHCNSTDDYETAGLRAEHYNTTAALQ